MNHLHVSPAMDQLPGYLSLNYHCMLMASFAGRRMLGDANQKEDAAFGCSLRGNLFTPVIAWSLSLSFSQLALCHVQPNTEHRWAVVLFLSEASD